MTQYIMHSDYRSLFGLDVHARTVSVSGIDLVTSEMKKKRFNDCPGVAEIEDWMRANFEGPYYAAYESGCTGFHLARELRLLGIDCDVIAVSSIARSTDERQRKSDNTDARRLLMELITPGSSIKRVWMPDEEIEAMRDLTRAHADGTDTTKRLKQQRSALLLRQGYVWNERTASGKLRSTNTREFESWLNQVKFASVGSAEAFSYYRSAIKESEDRVRYLEGLIEAHAAEERFKPYVDALCCLKSVSYISAFLYTVEIGDFSRFKNPPSLACYLGVTPTSGASGEDRADNGHITKAGPSHARDALIEGLQNVGGRNALPKRLKAGQVVSDEVRTHCECANRRMSARYEHLRKQKKLPNVIKIALANELCRWIWSVGMMVKKELDS